MTLGKSLLHSVSPSLEGVGVINNSPSLLRPQGQETATHLLAPGLPPPPPLCRPPQGGPLVAGTVALGQRPEPPPALAHGSREDWHTAGRAWSHRFLSLRTGRSGFPLTQAGPGTLLLPACIRPSGHGGSQEEPSTEPGPKGWGREPHPHAPVATAAFQAVPFRWTRASSLFCPRAQPRVPGLLQLEEGTGDVFVFYLICL